MWIPATRTCDAPAASGPARVPAEYEGRAVSPDQAVAAILEPTLDRVRDLKATPLGVVLETAIEIGTDPESPLGNLFTDVLLQAVPGAELAINNTFGGLRAALPEGPLTYGRLFETFPFDNMIVGFGLTGADTQADGRRSSAAGPQPARHRGPASAGGVCRGRDSRGPPPARRTSGRGQRSRRGCDDGLSGDGWRRDLRNGDARLRV